MKLENFQDETWEEIEGGRVVVYQQVVGNSCVYLIVTDKESGKVLRDDRPWQMRECVS